MIPINNSDTAWLITTDYNQDNNLPYIDLRQDIISPDTNQWHYENGHDAPQLGTLLDGVGTIYEYVGFENAITFPTVGGCIPRVICLMKAPVSLYVGGHRQFPLL
jgi:hypothetical protein